MGANPKGKGVKPRQDNHPRSNNGRKYVRCKPNRDPKRYHPPTPKKEVGEKKEYSADDGIFAMLNGALPSTPDPESSGTPASLVTPLADSTPTGKQYIYVCVVCLFHFKDAGSIACHH